MSLRGAALSPAKNPAQPFLTDRNARKLPAHDIVTGSMFNQLRFAQRAFYPGVCVALASSLIAGRAASLTETVLHNFSAPLRGNGSQSSLLLDSAGNLYGTSYDGGTHNLGVVFKLSPNGQETVLHSFAGGSDGASPTSAVTFDAAGNLYGTTNSGGANDLGTVYRLSAAGVESIVHSFAGGTDGANPMGGVIVDAAGNLFGTTSAGGMAMGVYGAGVVYKVDPSGIETLLHTFTTGEDGGFPLAGLVLDKQGNLYGTTAGAGLDNAGVIFKVSPAGSEAVIYTFTGGADGGFPAAALTLDANGNLYGTAENGGSGFGVVFTVSKAGEETVLHTFSGGSDGEYPQSGVIRDSRGNLFGTTAYSGTGGYGVVYKLTSTGTETILYSFSQLADAQGQDSEGGVIFGAAGQLYGATVGGGSGGTGVIYEVTGVGQENVLYNFPGSPGGFSPQCTLTEDASGNLYGTNTDGGIGFGLVFEILPSGQEKVLHTFTGGADGGLPLAGVTLDAAGNLYGTAFLGGAENEGVIYKLDPSGQETTLYSFTGNADGADPGSAVILDAQGNIYGTTPTGGAFGFGVVYRVTAAGVETVLHTFAGGTDGAHPQAGVTRDAAGNLYGTANSGGAENAGVVYRLDPAGKETILYSFTNGPDGGVPQTGLVLSPSGILYGTTDFGGMNNGGVVFKISGTTETVLFNFNFTDGMFPSTLVRGPAGNLYGTASDGGTNGDGVVFQITPSGEETILHDFSGTDGASPSGILLDSSGTLYGATFAGGAAGGGVVYQLKSTAP